MHREFASLLVGLMLLGYLVWRTVSVCRKFAPWVGWMVYLVDLGILLVPATPLLDALFRGFLFSVFGLGDGSEDLETGFSALRGAFPLLLFGLVVWRLFFFFMAFRWEPVRGLLQPPLRRPRAPFMRGPRRRRWREVQEPMPWFRGPSSY